MTAKANPLPPEVIDLAKLINKLRTKSFSTRADRELLRQAKLRLALWACKNEKLVVNRENLAYVLGADAAEVIGAYDRYLGRNAGKAGRKADRRDGKGGAFWDGA